MRLTAASLAVACLVVAACGGGDLVLPEDTSPAAVAAVRGNEQTAAPGTQLPAPIVVKVTDAQLRPVADVRVAFALGVGASGGVTTPDTALTNAGGEASTQWVLGNAIGVQQVEAEVVGAGLPVVSFTATAVEPDGPQPSAAHSSVTATPASIEVASGLSVITVVVRDELGDPMSGATVTLAATGLGNMLTQPSAPTGDDGVAEGTFQAITPGARVISAVVNGTVAITQTATVTVVTTPPPPEPRGLAFVQQPTDAPENEVITPAVAVAIVDDAGDVVSLSGIEIELELIRDEGQDSNELEGDTTQLTVGGVAVFPDLRVDRDEDGYRLRATAPDRPDLGSVDSESFDVED